MSVKNRNRKRARILVEGVLKDPRIVAHLWPERYKQWEENRERYKNRNNPSPDVTAELLELRNVKYHPFPHLVGQQTAMPFDYDGIIAWYESRKNAWRLHLMVGHNYRHGNVSRMYLLRTLRRNHRSLHRIMDASHQQETVRAN